MIEEEKTNKKNASAPVRKDQNMGSVQVEGLSYAYGDHPVLHEVSFTARPGELVSLLGKNGVGKSTLFKCMLGLLKDYTGSIRIGGVDMKTISARNLAKMIAYIPQSHYPSFNYSVMDMVLMGSANQLSSIGIPGKKQEKEALEALDQVGAAHLKDRGYGQISGGERQLVLMARAILQNAGIWILDEPTANLDYGNQIRVLEQLKRLAEAGYLIIQSTHNPDQTYQFSDRIIAVHDGTIAASGRPGEILTKELVEQLYQLDVELVSLYEDRVRVVVPQSVARVTPEHPSKHRE